MERKGMEKKKIGITDSNLSSHYDICIVKKVTKETHEKGAQWQPDTDMLQVWRQAMCT